MDLPINNSFIQPTTILCLLSVVEQCTRNMSVFLAAYSHHISNPLKWSARKSRSKQIDWTSLITPDIRSAFVADVRQEIDSGSDFSISSSSSLVRHLPFKRHSSYSRLQDDPRILNVRITVQRACSRYGQASTEHKVSLINLDEAYTRCAEEFAQNTIDDIEKHTLECRSAEAWKAINLFCGRKFRFTNCVNAESIDYMKLRIKTIMPLF